MEWNKGYPKPPYSKEWFIAETLHLERYVMRSLPSGISAKGDFTTANDDWFKKESIRRWMQFPDSNLPKFNMKG